MRRMLEGYIEPISQGFQTFENQEVNVPSGDNFRPEVVIDLAVGLQPHPGAMIVHSVPSHTTPVGKIPFVRV